MNIHKQLEQLEF